MKKYLSRPDISLLLMAGLIVAAGATTDSDATVDLHFHDTYYVISIFHLAIVYAVLLVAEAGLYTATSWFRQWRWLQVLHVVSMLLSPLILVVSSAYIRRRCEQCGLPGGQCGMPGERRQKLRREGLQGIRFFLPRKNPATIFTRNARCPAKKINIPVTYHHLRNRGCSKKEDSLL